MSRTMVLGASMATAGYHPACWRLPEVPATFGTDWTQTLRSAQIAEQGGFDLIFLADTEAVRDLFAPGLAREREHIAVKLDPLTLLPAIAACTERVGLVATANMTWHDPYTLARRLATLDHISGGRAGWNLVTGANIDEARNHGADTLPSAAHRYARAAEFLTVIERLWDSWDADAFLRDKDSGLFLDRTRMRPTNFTGAHFAVRGPLDVARCPQGAPVRFTAGDSETALDMAARVADGFYAGQPTFEGAKRFYAGLKGRLPAYGRAPDSLKIMPGLMPFVGRTQAEAQAKLDRVQALIDPALGLSLIAAVFGDMAGHDLDGPLPDQVGQPVMRYNDYSAPLLARARKEGMTIRQVYQALAAGNWQLTLVGTPETIADEMERWFRGGAADGFNILPPYQPDSLADFAQLVIPELRRRGLVSPPGGPATLRERLGLGPFTPQGARSPQLVPA